MDDFFREITDQSEVKSNIVEKYFRAWSRVMLARSRSDRLAYIDLFSGPGRYEDGKASTPLRVLQMAVSDSRLARSLVCIFNDRNPDYTSNLKQAIDQLPGIEKLHHTPAVYTSEVGDDMAEAFESIRLVPTLFFVDPWGYKGLSLRLINAVLKDWGCDAIFFFNYTRVNMGLTNNRVEPHIDALFGRDRAERLRTLVSELDPLDRELTVINELSEALKDLGGQYVLPFRFVAASGTRTSHYLVFVSKHPLGYTIMKDIMYGESEKEDGVARFEYIPNAPPQLQLLHGYSLPRRRLRSQLLRAFAGMTLTVREVFDQSHVGTPFVLRNYKDVLKELEADGVIRCTPPASQRYKNTLADDVRIAFRARGSVTRRSGPST